jgi:hypothetical protein
MQPCAISKEMTFSLHEQSNLRAMLNTWRGKALTEDEAKEFDLARLIGKECMINLIHQPSKSNPERVYERIAAVLPMMKGMVCPPQVNPSMEFSVLEFDRPKFESLPTFLQEMITGSTEYQAMMKLPPQPTNMQKEEMLHQQEVAAKLASDDAFDELPF